MPKSISGGRSPGYPFINLEKAVERLQGMYSYAKRNNVRVADLYKHWGISIKSASAKKTIAALKYYGLIEDSGKGADRMAVVTERGLKILLGSDDMKKQEIKEAALSPAMYRYLWNKYKDDMPHDDAVTSDLIFEKNFNEASVAGFIAGYKKTISYASITSSDPVIGKNDYKLDQQDEILVPKVGDTVQWTSQGQDMFPEPKKVRGIDESGDWIFVEDSETGIPTNEINIIEKKPSDTPPPVVPPTMDIPSSSGAALAKGEDLFMSSALSKNKENPVSFRLLVTGDIGVIEIGKLIKLLEAQKMILED